MLLLHVYSCLDCGQMKSIPIRHSAGTFVSGPIISGLGKRRKRESGTNFRNIFASGLYTGIVGGIRSFAHAWPWMVRL